MEDINRIKYVKRLFNKYTRSGEFKERLVLNHVIAFYNVFDSYAATRIWFTRIDKEHWSTLHAVLKFLGYMPRIIHGINETHVLSDELPLNEEVYNKLESL